MKALWIAFVICTPLLGLLVCWIFGPTAYGVGGTDAESRQSLEAAEASLKERLNRTYGKDAKD